MFVHYRTQGFVLKEIERGEADKVFFIFTKDFGKLEILARAVRKMKSKLRGGILVFSLSEVEFIQGKVYKTLTDAILINDFENIKKDLKRLKAAYRISEVFEQLIKAPEKDDKIWQLLVEVFKNLNSYPLPTIHYSLIYYYFLWNLCSILGYQPELYTCLICEKKLEPEELYFAPGGGIICDTCYKKETCLTGSLPKRQKPESLKVDVNTIKILREILKKDLSRFLKLKIKKEHQDSLKQVSDFYLSAILSQS